MQAACVYVVLNILLAMTWRINLIKKIEEEEEAYYKRHKKGLRKKKEFYPEPQRSVNPTPAVS